ncbi:hypothetical protein [Agaribacter marinus]|uniref:Uncharacterized protein n=1 Tax=Agaribacter marinus TaxID=1431249 RepID=A0AA37WJD9_9ALTE|nr:hypothetical protein [Agaribacter marinus]GLR72032.1 hypothetical protein GCM10007852_29400 [Agaribacter marinus]
MLGLLVFVSYVLSASYYYVESVVNGMNKRRWLFGGVVMGPLLLPMFQISKHMTVRKSVGFNSLYFCA